MTTAAAPDAASPAARGHLRCRGLFVAIDGAAILHDVDLDVAAGTLTTVVGPSGAGKTTLLRAVAGLAPTTAGSIHLDGVDLATRPVHDRGLAMVFQQPRLFPSMTVRDNVAFALRMGGMARPERRRRADELLDEVGLDGTGGRAVDGLSGGEAQRVALARALAGDPAAVLLDEPLSAVDPERREALRDLLRRVQRGRRVTMVSVTHDRTEAAVLGDHVALVLDGTVVHHAPPVEVFERPATAAVARFFGATNLLTGTVRDGRLTAPGLDLPVAGAPGPAVVSIRPEHLVPAGPDAPTPPGWIDGAVVAAEYRGGHHHVRVARHHHARSGPGTDPGSDPGAGPVLALLAVDRPPTLGNPVRLGVAARHVWRLPDPAVEAGP